MDLGLEGKRALVTGSTAGIGFATASLLAREGARVIVNGRTQARVDAAVERLRGDVGSAQVEGVVADLGNVEGCNTLTQRIAEVDILVNNAVTVNAVLPGPTASEGVGRFVADLAAARGVDPAAVEREFFPTARQSSILQRFETPDEVAAMIVYLCSTRASAPTGAAVRVDGGVVRAIV